METLDNLIEELTEEIDVKPKRIVREGFEKLSKLEPVKADMRSRGAKKRDKRGQERSLSPTEKLTLDAIRLRETLNPTKFYKKRATEHIGKDFQIGTVISDPMDFYSSRATRRECKQTLVDELIADAQFKKNVKRRYNRLRATDAIKKKEKALADRRRMLQGKKKNKLKTST